jgi:hypothetical protein
MLDKTAREVKDTTEFITLCQEMHIMLEPKLEAHHFTKGRTYCAAICCIVASANCMQIKQKEISEATGFTIDSIRVQAKRILEFLGYESLREIKGKTIEEMNKC